MSVTISGDGTITGLDADGISSQPVFPGNVIQVVSVVYSTGFSTTSTSFVDTGLNASITPTSASNKVLVIISNPIRVFRAGEDAAFYAQIVRDSTNIVTLNNEPFYIYSAGGAESQINGVFSYTYLDSPSTTSSTNYKMQIRTAASSSTSAQNGSQPATITLMEIAA
jgi:hypothetical protein